jgi:hypothetical protein
MLLKYNGVQNPCQELIFTVNLVKQVVTNKNGGCLFKQYLQSYLAFWLISHGVWKVGSNIIPPSSGQK